MRHVFSLWEAHKDDFCPRSGGQESESGAAVYDQVEFDASPLAALVIGVGDGVVFEQGKERGGRRLGFQGVDWWCGLRASV